MTFIDLFVQLIVLYKEVMVLACKCTGVGCGECGYIIYTELWCFNVGICYKFV
jgi:mevalonate kinase